MPAEKIINNCRISVVKGDITESETDAFVFYARSDLKLGAGFGNAIAVRGGASIQKELDGMGSKEVCEVVISGAGNLKAKKILHAVGPKFQELDTEAKLERTMVNALKLAADNGLKRVGFPPMGTGFYVIPLQVSAEVMFRTLADYLKNNGGFEEITIYAMDNREYHPFKAQLEKID